jgi:acyl-CoA reductase-like NAD-dependent aldehyde dehydrogenase
MESYKMWIGGKWLDAESGETFTVVNPANGEIFAGVALGGKPEVDKAVDAARKAFPVWSKKTQSERSRIMLQIVDAIKERSQELAELETRDHGFPITTSSNMGQMYCGFFEYTAQVARGLMSEVIPVHNNLHLYMQREPIGVTALITPWNAPLSSVAKKVAYSISVGNTCVVKPASDDCLTALKFCEILEKTGLPPGTVNIITGPGSTAGEYLASHPGVNMISFTGSCEIGKRIMAAASSTVKRVQLELGGKNPFIVLEDVDVDAVVRAAVAFSVGNAGQGCGAPGRFYIHQKIHDEFVEKFVAGMKKVIVGDPMDKKTQMGPLASAEHRGKVEGYLKSGIKEGANLVLGGQRPSDPPLDKGYYVMPAVFTGVKQNMTIAREEIFGPVACFMEPFSTDQEVIERANDNTLGLSACVWTKNTGKGMKLAGEIQAGAVWVNSAPAPFVEAPWGGFKESGIGKEYSKIGFDDVTQMKVIGVSLA